MRTKTGLAGCGLALAAALSVVACSGSETTTADPDFDVTTASWDEIVEQAEQEGEVTLYLALANYEDHLLEGFSEAYPDIELTIVREPSGDLITKALAERDSGSAGGDVVLLSDYRFFADNEGELAEPQGESNALYTDELDPNGGDSYATVIGSPFGPVSNTEVLDSVGADPIEEYADLIQPELNGLIGITRPEITPVEVQFLYRLHQELGPQFLEDLAALGPHLGESSGTLVQSVAAGDLAVAIGGGPVNANIVKTQGAPVDAPVGQAPQFLIGYAAGVLDWSHHPAAAQVLYEWLISQDGQAYQHGWGLTASVLPEVPGEAGVSTDQIFTGQLSAEEEEFLSTTWADLFG